jgi:hypothetical protein
MKTQLEMMVSDCERSLLSGQFKFDEEWLDNFLIAAKDYMKEYNDAACNNEEELEELHSKLKRARRYVDDVSLADVRYALD